MSREHWKLFLSEELEAGVADKSSLSMLPECALPLIDGQASLGPGVGSQDRQVFLKMLSQWANRVCPKSSDRLGRDTMLHNGS
jgi:hypothetical protein